MRSVTFESRERNGNASFAPSCVPGGSAEIFGTAIRPHRRRTGGRDQRPTEIRPRRQTRSTERDRASNSVARLDPYRARAHLGAPCEEKSGGESDNLNGAGRGDERPAARSCTRYGRGERKRND